MKCPACLKEVSPLASRCEHCTEPFGTKGLWSFNFTGWFVVIVVLLILGAMG